MIRALRNLFTKPIDWNARLEADRAMRLRLVGSPYAKRRAAAIKGSGAYRATRATPRAPAGLGHSASVTARGAA